jgi:hypothetical protein
MQKQYLLSLKKHGPDRNASMLLERFQANIVTAMQKKKILGVVSMYVVVALD